MITLAIITISAALVFYTIAVFWERKTGYLRGIHLLFFVLGLICDTTGTTLMGQLANNQFTLNFHSITGALAILLMLLHTIWAIVVHASKRAEPKINFRKYSIFVWILWLLPYISGMVFGMAFLNY